MSSNTVLEEEDEIKMKMIQSTAHTHRLVAMTNCGGRMRIAMESENWKKSADGVWRVGSTFAACRDRIAVRRDDTIIGDMALGVISRCDRAEPH